MTASKLADAPFSFLLFSFFLFFFFQLFPLCVWIWVVSIAMEMSSPITFSCAIFIGHWSYPVCFHHKHVDFISRGLYSTPNMFNPSFSFLNMWNEIILTILTSLSTTLLSASLLCQFQLIFLLIMSFIFLIFFFLHDSSFYWMLDIVDSTLSGTN